MLNPAAAAAAAAAARHPVSNPIKLFYNHQNILQLHTPHLYFCMPIFFSLIGFSQNKSLQGCPYPFFVIKIQKLFLIGI